MMDDDTEELTQKSQRTRKMSRKGNSLPASYKKKIGAIADHLEDITTVSDTGVIVLHNNQSMVEDVGVGRGRGKRRGGGILSPQTKIPGAGRKSSMKTNTPEENSSDTSVIDTMNNYMRTLWKRHSQL